MLRGAIHVIAGAIGLTLAGGCSLILDFDDPVVAVDAPKSVDAAIDGAPVDAASLACTLFEPNDTVAEAAGLTAATYQIGLCPIATDIDYYRLDLSDRTGDVELYVLADLGAMGSVVLFDETGTATVATAEDPEADQSYAIDVQLPPAAYILRVSGMVDGTTPGDTNYALTIDVVSAPLPDAGMGGPGGKVAEMPTQ